MPIVIIEGADGSGKSNLARALRAVKGMRVSTLSSSGMPPTKEQLLAEVMWLACVPDSMTLICDRHRLISEAIYGPILRGVANVPEGEKSLAQWLSGIQASIVYCRPGFEQISTNVESNKDRQLAGVVANLSAIVQAYDELMIDLERSKIPIIWYDYSHSSIDEIAKRIGLTHVNHI